MHVCQGEAKGLGHAIMCAKPIVGDNDFVVVLPDVILDEYTMIKNQKTAAMIARFNASSASQIMLEPVAEADVSKYGIADINGAKIKAGESAH